MYKELNEPKAYDAPIVDFVNNTLVDAIQKEASDLHFEPYANEYRIRYRQDGILHEISTPPLHLASRIAARIKIMAQLDSAEKRLPQDGAFTMKLSPTQAIDFRVSTCPTTEGEKVVIRVLDSRNTQVGIDGLGLNSIQQSLFIQALNKPQGLILATGPTGSGKTVSLYTALNLLNSPNINISTVEDPIEIKITGINQVNINPKIGLSFAKILRSFLRQDPDVIMLGEIRDMETAEIAIKASQTGHLVLSTLHTNSASQTVTRLIQMGIPSFNLASSLSLIIAQRLARKLCSYCKIKKELTSEELIKIGFKNYLLPEITLFDAVGCNLCSQGYKGRIGLFEVLTMNQSLRQLILNGGNELDISTMAQNQGMTTIYEAGLCKAAEGLISLQEVNRVTVE